MRIRLFAIAIAVLLPALAGADQQPALAEDEDVQFEEALRDLGFVSGAAYQCLPEAERAEHDRQVLDAYSGIARLFGTDRAFLYAAAFGAGTSMSLDKAKCPTYIDEFRAATRRGERFK
ncbi:MAG TPA: hypothetical protein VLA75_12550 [Thermoanaerobaculia bacterium]|nr:hypothetical protein [Thermoanaerobaculia bacterium]